MEALQDDADAKPEIMRHENPAQEAAGNSDQDQIDRAEPPDQRIGEGKHAHFGDNGNRPEAADREFVIAQPVPFHRAEGIEHPVGCLAQAHGNNENDKAARHQNPEGIEDIGGALGRLQRPVEVGIRRQQKRNEKRNALGQRNEIDKVIDGDMEQQRPRPEISQQKAYGAPKPQAPIIQPVVGAAINAEALGQGKNRRNADRGENCAGQYWQKSSSTAPTANSQMLKQG